MSAKPRNRRSRRPLTGADRVTLAAALVSLIAGVVMLIAASGFAAAVVAVVLIGLAGIAFVALAFLLVGESEDRDYAGRGPSG
jgi:hypothetical protein